MSSFIKNTQFQYPKTLIKPEIKTYDYLCLNIENIKKINLKELNEYLEMNDKQIEYVINDKLIMNEYCELSLVEEISESINHDVFVLSSKQTIDFTLSECLEISNYIATKYFSNIIINSINEISSGIIISYIEKPMKRANADCKRIYNYVHSL